jgi:hypothetical protein
MAPATIRHLLSLPRALAGLPLSLPLLQLRFLSLQHNHSDCKHISMHYIRHCAGACIFDHARANLLTLRAITAKFCASACWLMRHSMVRHSMVRHSMVSTAR